MYTFGRNARPEEGESAMFGNLSLVGVGGKFRVTITQRQLVLSNSLNKGIRLDLASISRTRSIDIPRIPSGAILWGGAACYLGATILIPPLGYAVSLLGAGTVISHFILKNPALVIETNIGDRHIIQSKLQDQMTLLKLQMIIQKVSNGQSVAEAKASLEKEFRITIDPKVEPKGLLNAPNMEDINIDDTNQVRSIIHQLETIDVEPQYNIPHNKIQTPIMDTNLNLHENTNFQTPEISEQTSAYQQTWGRSEPDWYNEKKTDNRIDSVLEDATETMDSDLFGFGAGGMFDTEPAASSFNEPVNYSPPPIQQPPYSPPEQYISQQDKQIEDEKSIFGAYNTELETRRRPISSAEMIKAANGLKRSPVNNYYNNLELPAPTDDAVRTECKPGLVKRAKAQQSLQRRAEIIASLPAPTDLEEYPGLSKIQKSLGNGRLIPRNQPIRKRKLGFFEKLLVPRSRNFLRENPSYESEYGDPDGNNVEEGARFQSKQHLRLRSDQEHQANMNNIRNMSNSTPSSAKDALNIVVDRVARGERRSPTLLVDGEPILRFNQMRRTSSKENSGHVKGIRRLE